MSKSPVTLSTRYWIQACLPAVCVLCRDPSAGNALCADCLADLPSGNPACGRCALPLPTASDDCGDCQRRPPAWDEAMPALVYDHPVDSLVRGLKFHRQHAAGRALIEAMWQQTGRTMPATDDALVPVPLHRWRYLRRGYNQAALLASGLARQGGWACLHGLQRIRHTPPQSQQDAHRRQRGLASAFRWKGPSLDGLTVWLIDDVLTTGATLSACTRVLKKAGAGRVGVWVAARTPLD